jgi:ribosomal protein S18 acetylase RimI-like enzyme
MGVGEMLSLRIVRAARERGAEGLGLMLFEDNLPAVRLYQKLGFQKHDFPGLKERFEEEERAGGRRHMSMMVSFQDPNRRESP